MPLSRSCFAINAGALVIKAIMKNLLDAMPNLLTWPNDPLEANYEEMTAMTAGIYQVDVLGSMVDPNSLPFRVLHQTACVALMWLY